MIDPGEFEPGPLAEVWTERDGERWVLVFVQELPHAPEAVWSALTDPAQLREWAPYTADRDLGSTGEATLTMVDGMSSEELPGAVLRAEAPSVLEYTWGEDLLRWELTATDGGTRLTLRHRVDSEEMVLMVAAGWHICLVVLERLLAGAPIGPIRGSEAMAYGWDELRAQYAAKLVD